MPQNLERLFKKLPGKVKKLQNNVLAYALALNTYVEIARYTDDGVLIATKWVDEPMEVVSELGELAYKKADDASEEVAELALVKDKDGNFGVALAKAGGDLASFMNKSLADKLKHIDDIWKTKYPIPDMLGGRNFLEDVMGQYRYTKSSGWLHTGDISFNFKGIDFYKGTETGSQIFANTAVSMKTTIQTDVNTWLNYQSIKDNIRFLRDGMNQTVGIASNGKTMFISDAKIHIYMPKANVTPTLKTQWMNKLNTDYPDIGFEIKAIEDFVN